VFACGLDNKIEQLAAHYQFGIKLKQVFVVK
jgi:hypothetical protein